ncbi:HAMP domain-containing histidine kinase [Candidatus Gottesmanbacteria bacterium]|nr:HAMP domain-containing histidine kinase [Candidatus Gottesmanbacteria bacterium]
MNKFLKTLRARLFFWYTGTLIIFALFFYFVIHILALPYGNEYFFFLFLLLACIGFYIIYKITNSITYLSHRIRHISRKNLEERILDIESEDEIGELASSFNSLLDNLDDAFKREQQFIADVAHELKTPLTTQRSSLEVTLSQDRTKETYKKALEEALDENNHLSSTLKNVLDLAWSETHEEKKNSSIFNLSELLEELADIAEKIKQSKNIVVKSSIHKDIFVNGFKDKLARALLNIIDNAVKYTHAGSLSLKLRKTHNQALLTISDTGQGIEEKELPKIFNRFYRGSKTDKILGSGLGLAITKSIVSLHQGNINVESKLNKPARNASQSDTGGGTTFTISLPLAQ